MYLGCNFTTFSSAEILAGDVAKCVFNKVHQVNSPEVVIHIFICTRAPCFFKTSKHKRCLFICPEHMSVVKKWCTRINNFSFIQVYSTFSFFFRKFLHNILVLAQVDKNARGIS